MLLFLVICINVIAQRINNDTALAIKRYAYEIDSANIKFDSFKLSIDSIEINAKAYQDKIVTTNFFENSKSVLTISFYFKENKLVEAKIDEQSPRYNDMHRYSLFYFENNRMFYANYYRDVQLGIQFDWNKDGSSVFGYNRNLDDDFLKKYIIILYNRIKTTESKKLNKKLITELPKAI